MFLTSRARLLFKTEDPPTGGTGTGDDGKRKAEGAVVDQVHGLDDRVKRLETPFYARLFAEAEKKKETPAKTGEEEKRVAVPRAKTVLEEFEDCVDPFELFKEPVPPPKAEAPAQDDAAA